LHARRSRAAPWPSHNLRYSNAGKLAVCDFGLARKYGDPIKPYTTNVVTLYYRCPELLLGAKTYSTALDMWSVGCIMAEIVAGDYFFEGKPRMSSCTACAVCGVGVGACVASRLNQNNNACGRRDV